MTDTSLAIRSLIGADGTLKLYLDEVPIPSPGPGEVVVAIDGAPVNPADIGMLFGPADVAAGRVEGSGERAVFSAQVPAAALRGVAGRLDQPLAVGTEGTGIVVAAGDDVKDLIGRRLAVFGGATYARRRLAVARHCLVMPADVTAEEAASGYANPMTALCILHTMRRGGYKALVHTAAASALGQMLVRLCRADGVDIVCIVRGEEQAQILRNLGARHVCNSSAPSFQEDLVKAILETDAYVGFDALGGGTLVSQILLAMEIAAGQRATGAAYSRYGSVQHKQMYIYGGLAGTTLEITRNFGMAWGIGGWLLMTVVNSLSEAELDAMKQRVVKDLRTVFRTEYGHRIGLAGLLSREAIDVYYRRATGHKFLVNPQA